MDQPPVFFGPARSAARRPSPTRPTALSSFHHLSPDSTPKKKRESYRGRVGWRLPHPIESTTVRRAAAGRAQNRRRRSGQGPLTRRPVLRAGGRRRCWQGDTQSGGGRTPLATWCVAASGAATAASAMNTTTSFPSPKEGSLLLRIARSFRLG